MRVSSYELRIPEAEVGLYPNWFILNHKSEYTLEFRNHSNSGCEVHVNIVGLVRFDITLEAGEKRIIENPFRENNERTYLLASEIPECLIFYSKGSLEAVERDKQHAEMKDYGIIQATFSPHRVGEDTESVILYPAMKPS